MRVNKTQRAVADLYNSLWFLATTANAPNYFTEALRGAWRMLNKHSELANKIKQTIYEQQQEEEADDN